MQSVNAIKTSTKNQKRRHVFKPATAWLHIMLLPSVLIIFVYQYLPMAGIVIAFQSFDIAKGISAFWESSWVGWANFNKIFSDSEFIQALVNTLRIALLKMICGFFVPIIVALLLNELRQGAVKRSIQTIVYLPHFLSWVILAGIIKDILSYDGMVNSLLQSLFHMKPYFWLGDSKLFVPILVVTNIWKEFGFSTIVYLAAITSVDPNLYEASMMDGASRWKQTWHVTLPGMRPIIVLCATLSLGGILNAGFDQVFNLYSVPVYSTGDIIGTLVFRKSIQGAQYEIGTAIGLFNSTVSFIMISLSYWFAYKVAHYEIF